MVWSPANSKALRQASEVLLRRSQDAGVALLAPACYVCRPCWANVALLCRKHRDEVAGQRPKRKE